MKVLDLFCGAGGAGMGYHRAGFEVIGVDLSPQPDYPFEFHQGDALDWLRLEIGDFDLVHASPPCQGYTTMSNRHAEAKAAQPRLIEDVRRWLELDEMPYVIENVMGAKSALRGPIRLCGSMFGLPIHRHRLFETSPKIAVQPECNHAEFPNTLGIYGRHHDGRRLWTRADGSELRAPRTLEQAQVAMEMPWADWHGVKEAIPPAFTEWIAHRMLEMLPADEEAA